MPDFCIGFKTIPLNDPHLSTTVSLSGEVFEPITSLVDRANAGDVFVSALAERVQHQLGNPNATFDSRWYPLLATYAVPGGGKSFFLDQLAACKGRVPGSSALPKMDELLRDAIFINISYNGIQQGGSNTTCVQGLAIRLLHS